MVCLQNSVRVHSLHVLEASPSIKTGKSSPKKRGNSIDCINMDVVSVDVTIQEMS